MTKFEKDETVRLKDMEDSGDYVVLIADYDVKQGGSWGRPATVIARKDNPGNLSWVWTDNLIKVPTFARGDLVTIFNTDEVWQVDFRAMAGSYYIVPEGTVKSHENPGMRVLAKYLKKHVPMPKPTFPILAENINSDDTVWIDGQMREVRSIVRKRPLNEVHVLLRDDTSKIFRFGQVVTISRG